MKHINEYIQDSLDLHKFGQQINEDVQTLYAQNADVFASISLKIGKYNKDILGNQFNEADESYNFTIDEQQVIQEMLVNICNTYIYKTQITESLVGKLNDLWQYGKDKIEQGIDAAKIKVKQIKEFLEEIKGKAIKSVKELVLKFTKLISTLQCSIQDLFETLGFDTDKIYKDIYNGIDDTAKDEKIEKVDIFSEDKDAEVEKVDNDKPEKIKSTDSEEIRKKDPTSKIIKDKAKVVLNKIWDDYKGVLIEVVKSTFFTWVLPSLIVIIGGPALEPAAKLVRAMAQAWFSSKVFVKIVEVERSFHQRGEYQNLPTWGKILRAVIFLLILCWTAWQAKDSFNMLQTILRKGPISKIISVETLTVFAGSVYEVIKDAKFSDKLVAKIKAKTINILKEGLINSAKKWATATALKHGLEENVVEQFEIIFKDLPSIKL